ncbi:DnaJ domain containing protein [Rhodovulum sulfidophilum]|uniref:DnaJ domain containing protein n=1 Tax=Rhodovulum sulfidophilum TaxID=35806 RepID=A0A0D6B5W8_RHOSU|nr:DnaJ domain containing protein [Rhodovulum sulfidophilum]
MIMMDLISVLFGMSRSQFWQIDGGYSQAALGRKGGRGKIGAGICGAEGTGAGPTAFVNDLPAC